MRFDFGEVYISHFSRFKFVVAGYSGVEIFAGEISTDIQTESVYHNSIWQLQRCKMCWPDSLLDLCKDVIVSNGELHLRISHLQGGMNAFHWKKAWLRLRKKQQRRSICCCNEERH